MSALARRAIGAISIAELEVRAKNLGSSCLQCKPIDFLLYKQSHTNRQKVRLVPQAVVDSQPHSS